MKVVTMEAIELVSVLWHIYKELTKHGKYIHLKQSNVDRFQILGPGRSSVMGSCEDHTRSVYENSEQYVSSFLSLFIGYALLCACFTNSAKEHE